MLRVGPDIMQHVRWIHLPTGKTGVWYGKFYSAAHCIDLLQSWSDDRWWYQPCHPPWVSPIFIGPPAPVPERDYTQPHPALRDKHD